MLSVHRYMVQNKHMKTSSSKKIRLKIASLVIGLGLFTSPVLQSAEIITVGETSAKATSTLGSSVVPKKQVLLSAQIPGRILSLAGKVGTSYRQGDVIAEIDPTALLAKRNSVVAQISMAQANLYNAQVQYQREVITPRRDDISAMPGFGFPAMMDQFITRPMADMMGTTDSDVSEHADLINSQTAVSQANFALQQAQAQLQEIDSSLRDSKTIAPFDGMIIKKMAEVGDTVQPGQPLVELGYTSALQLQADVPSGLISGLKQGGKVNAKLGGKVVQATVAEIHPVADPERHTIVVKFDLPTGVKAYPGMYAEVMVPLSSNRDSSTVTIPKTALLKGRSLPSVLVVQGDASVLRLVRLGSEGADGVLEVVSGLTAGDKVINNPPSGVASGWLPQ